MEGAPDTVDSDKLINEIRALSIEGRDTVDVHDFHVWSISVGKYALSCHITTNRPMEVLKAVTKICKTKYKVDHLAI